MRKKWGNERLFFLPGKNRSSSTPTLALYQVKLVFDSSSTDLLDEHDLNGHTVEEAAHFKTGPKYNDDVC
jgi:hypothetical protein